MSASKEKNNRIAARSEGLSKKAEAEAEQVLKNKKFQRNTILVIVAVVILLAGALIINSDLLYTRTTAVQVGETSYSPAEMSYFYKNAVFSIYNNLVDQYGQDTADQLLDPSSSLKDQYYTTENCWADVALETTTTDMQRVAVYYDAAMKAGYTMSDEGRQTVEDSVKTMESYAIVSGFKSVDKFFASYFGKGVDEALFTDLMERTVIANEYSTALLDGLTYTDDELNAYYEAHADELNYYNFYAYSVSSANAAFLTMSDEEKPEAMRKAAEHIAEAKDADGFVSRVHEMTGNDDFYSMNHNTRSGISTYYVDWITDPARQPGDTTVIDMDGTYAALLFVSMDDNNYNTVDFRHVLIKPEEDEDGVITQEALETAKTQCMNLQEQWLKDPTEEQFAAYAAEYSEDTGSSSNGGLYTAVTKNSMVDGINEFLFSPDTEPGCTAVIYGTNGSYTGYHFVYFVGQNDNARSLMSESLLQNEDFSALYEEISAGYDVETQKAMKYAAIY